MVLTFNGVMRPPNALPGFCIFKYRVLPLAYLFPGITAALQDQAIQCPSAELRALNPPTGSTCGQYLAPCTSCRRPVVQP
jgi:ABC-type multidrug transport system permease subunit